MGKKIIYSGFNFEYGHIIDYLCKEHQWDPVVIVDIKHSKGWAEKNYSKAVFYDWMSLRNAQFDYSAIGKKVPIDAKIIAALSEHQSLALEMVQDTTEWNFSFQERRRYYYDLLEFWNTVIHNLKPDMYIAETFPHILYEYTLYHLCKYYGIPVMYVNPASLFYHDDNFFIHVGTSLEDQSNVFKKTYDSNEKLGSSEHAKNYLTSVRSKKGMAPPYITRFVNMFKKRNPTLWDQWPIEFARVMKMLLTGRFFDAFESDWKCNRHPFYSKKSKMNYLQHLFFRERIRRDDANLKKIYAAFAKPADLNRKYLYYAAAFQPEANIWSVYRDQYLALDLLTASIPDDWVIYFKDHYSTFVEGDKASLMRNEDYYKRVASYKKVQIIPYDEDTFKLIDGAQAVATPAGTVGWESIVRGKPALIFGCAWYQGCKSVFKIESYQDCMDAIEKIKNGYKPDPADIERFVAAIEKVSGKNIIHGWEFREKINACPDPVFEMQRLAKLYYEAYERNYGNK